MSNVSSCDGPPISISRMQLTSLFVVAPRAFRANQSVRLSPSVAKAPAWRKSRRLKPSQNSTGRSASRRNIPVPSPGGCFYHWGTTRGGARGRSGAARRGPAGGAQVAAWRGGEGLGGQAEHRGRAGVYFED